MDHPTGRSTGGAPSATRPTAFDACGGSPAMLVLARAWHARCLADPVAEHPFTHKSIHPHHSERLAAYWGESLGGPPGYTSALGSETDVVRAHSGNGPHDELDAAAAGCFAAALDDVDLPRDPALRATLVRWFAWSNQLVNHGWPTPADVPDDLRLPRWDWDGPVS